MESSIYFFTDCHFKENFKIENSKINSLSKIVSNDKNKNIYFAFSGDIAFSGKAIEYKAFEAFINEVKAQSQREIKLVVCPGNHDINYQKDEEYTLKELIEDIKPNQVELEEKNRFQKMASYYAFERNNIAFTKDDDYLSHISYDDNDGEILFYSLNNVVFSCFGKTNNSDSTRGYAYIPDKTISKIKRTKPTQLVVLLMHFPTTFFSDEFGHEFKKRISSNVDILLNGHLHFNEEETILGKGDISVIQGTYFSEKGLSDNGGFTKVDLENKEYYTFQWSGDSFSEQSPKRKICSNHIKRNVHGISFDEDYYSELTKFSILDEPFSLEDIFVFPDLLKEKYDDDSEKNTFIRKFSSLLSKIKNNHFIFIYGDENSGKTMLANYLTISLFNENYVPLLCTGESLYRAKNVNNLIKTRIKEMYQSSDVVISNYMNELSTNNKILIVDDYNGYDNSRLLELKNNFDSIIIISKSEDNSFIKKPKYFEGEMALELSIQPMVKTKRKEFTYKLYSALSNSGKTSTLAKEQFFSAVENQLDNIAINDICDPMSLACIEIKAYQSTDSFDNKMFSSVNQARSLITLDNVKNRYSSNYNILAINRIISNLAYSLYEQQRQRFSSEEVTLAICKERENYGDPGIPPLTMIKIMKEALITKELDDLTFTFMNRDIFSYYIAYYIHSQIEDGEHVAFTYILNKDIFVPINFNILMCLSSIYNNKVIPNRIIDLVLHESVNEQLLDPTNFSIDGITKEKQEELKRLTEDDIRQINERQDIVEREKHEVYLENKNNLYFVDNVSDKVKEISIWLDRLKICCVLLKKFSGSLKRDYKEKLINLVISLPNLVLNKFNDYLFKELDEIYATLKENAPKDSVVSNMVSFNNYIISIKRAFILSTYDYGARCFVDSASKDILKALMSKPDNDLAVAQKLMYESFIIRGDTFVNSCMSILKDKEIKDNSFVKSAARLIGRRYIIENFELCNSKYKNFVNMIFESPKVALQYKTIEESRK